MNCPVCRNFVFDHLENLSLKGHPLESFVRLKQLKKKLPDLLLELQYGFKLLLPFRRSYSLHPTTPLSMRLCYESEYLKSLEDQSETIKKEIEHLVIFLLEFGILSGKSLALPELARQFLAGQIVYFLETIPEIHELHKKNPSCLSMFKPLQKDEVDLYA